MDARDTNEATAIEQARSEKLRRVFERIANLPNEEQSVEFAFDAQREVVLELE
jgi:hypothetical protein